MTPFNFIKDIAQFFLEFIYYSLSMWLKLQIFIFVVFAPILQRQTFFYEGATNIETFSKEKIFDIDQS